MAKKKKKKEEYIEDIPKGEVHDNETEDRKKSIKATIISVTAIVLSVFAGASFSYLV